MAQSPVAAHSDDVIVVDDDELAIELFARRLRKSGRELRSFSDEQAALEYLRTHSANILFMDQRMPVIDGLDLLQKLADEGVRPADRIYLCSAADLPPESAARAAAIGAECVAKEKLRDQETLQSLLD